jgi:hypothetical protein
LSELVETAEAESGGVVDFPEFLSLMARKLKDAEGEEDVVEAFRGESLGNQHARMIRCGHGLPKVSLGSAMPDPSTPCGRLATVFYPLDIPHMTGMTRISKNANL